EAGVVDEHVYDVTGLRDAVVEFLGRAWRCEVVCEHVGAAALAAELGGERCEAVLGAGGEEEVRAVAGELAGHRLADAAGGAGDEDGAAVVRLHDKSGGGGDHSARVGAA